MVTSSSDYSSSSSEDDSKTSAAKTRANTDHAKKTINASDSDAEEEEPTWEPMERRSRPYPPHMEIERLVEADLQDERDEEDYWDAMYGDVEEEFPSSDSDSSEKESEEDSSEDDDDDDDDDESDDSDD
ncbi:calsequestrin-1-like [Papaver somniferum]|uniref:calsequestrin-1-like n=1 Tax=Papaver somniferum TaxID=3469 RepID=UPI000E6FE6ED|nr:calsequestrin-1-like [Papaver somniferum]